MTKTDWLSSDGPGALLDDVMDRATAHVRGCWVVDLMLEKD